MSSTSPSSPSLPVRQAVLPTRAGCQNDARRRQDFLEDRQAEPTSFRDGESLRSSVRSPTSRAMAPASEPPHVSLTVEGRCRPSPAADETDRSCRRRLSRRSRSVGVSANGLRPDHLRTHRERHSDQPPDRHPIINATRTEPAQVHRPRRRPQPHTRQILAKRHRDRVPTPSARLVRRPRHPPHRTDRYGQRCVLSRRPFTWTRHKRTKPYTPRHNGKVERYNRILSEEFLYAGLGPPNANAHSTRGLNIHYNYHRPHCAADDRSSIHGPCHHVMASYN